MKDTESNDSKVFNYEYSHVNPVLNTALKYPKRRRLGRGTKVHSN